MNKAVVFFCCLAVMVLGGENLGPCLEGVCPDPYICNLSGECVTSESEQNSCPPGDGITSMDDNMRSYVLQEFNGFRYKLANGMMKTSNGTQLPSGKNIIKLTYNCTLETIASKYLDTTLSYFWHTQNFPDDYFQTNNYAIVVPISDAIHRFITTISLNGPTVQIDASVVKAPSPVLIHDWALPYLLDDTAQIGCSYGTHTNPAIGIESSITCVVTPYPKHANNTIIYSRGDGCTKNSDCTKPGFNLCDGNIGLCYENTICEDLGANCESFDASQCANPIQKNNVEVYCRKTCGVCSSTPQCADISPDCATLKPFCTDPLFKDCIQSNCQKTCGLCPTPPPSPMPTTTTVSTSTTTPRPTPSTFCGNGDGLTTYNNGSRAYIVGRFNAYRSQVALGKYVMQNGQKTPSGSNMLKLSYNCTLENEVQLLASNCEMNGTIPGAQVLLHYEYVGTINQTFPSGSWWNVTLVKDATSNAVKVDDQSRVHALWSTASQIGCAFRPNCPGFGAVTFCALTPPMPSWDSSLYNTGPSCTTNAHCTLPGFNKCEVASGLCTAL